ncbi:MAG: hypothetical protein LUD76_12435 [Alistipes sp.]|nr:hypothetical protein [Alistipes sp.]
MKTTKTRTAVAALVLFMLCAVSCSKDDKVDLDKLTGFWMWDTTYPHHIADVGASYRFDEDGTYIKQTYGFMEEPGYTVTEGKYVVSIMGNPRVLTLYVDETVSEQYTIKKLTSREILLENTSDEAFPEVMKLLRAEASDFF